MQTLLKLCFYIDARDHFHTLSLLKKNKTKQPHCRLPRAFIDAIQSQKLTNPFPPKTHLRTVSINMGQRHRSRQPKWNEVSGRSASLRVPSASNTKPWQEALGLGRRRDRGRDGDVDSFHLGLGRPCLRPAHRRRSVFTPLDYKDPHFCP